MHTPLQTIEGGRHTTQALFVQVSLAAQVLPQAPQLSRSCRGSRQAALQRMVGRAQPAHTPLSQVIPARQGLLQSPQ